MKEAKQLFQKLKIISLLDLALLIPSSYNNTTLSEQIKLGETQTFDARVENVSNVQGKLRITFYLKKCNKRLNSCFFG